MRIHRLSVEETALAHTRPEHANKLCKGEKEKEAGGGGEEDSEGGESGWNKGEELMNEGQEGKTGKDEFEEKKFVL